MFSIPYFFS